MSTRLDKQKEAQDALAGKVQYTETVHHTSAREKLRQGPTKIPQMNLTSMMDVTFLLLIFFVLTANFAVGEGIIAANLPTGQSSSDPIKPNQEPVKIILMPVHGSPDEVRIHIEGVRQIENFSQLYTYLKSQRYDPKTNTTGPLDPDNPIIIKPLSGIQWDHIVNAFNACVRARYENVNFAQAG